MNKVVKKFLPGSLKDGFLPYLPLASDIYLVSYPKSGNTWLRFMLAAYLTKALDMPYEANWFTVREIIPDVQVDRKVALTNLVKKRYGSRIIKSHSPYKREYKRVILLTRRPEDAITSCYRYFRTNNYIAASVSLREFIEHHEMGMKGWNEHTLGWLSHYKVGSVIRHYSYEDLKTKTAETLGLIVDLLGLPVVENYISYAVQVGSRENMARSESLHRSSVALSQQNERFVGEGRIGGADMIASDEDVSYILAHTEEARKILGYQ